MFKNAIVGVDGEEGGRDAIALAKILRAEHGELTLAYVYHGDAQVWRGSSPPYEAAEEERTRELMEQAGEEAGVEARLRTHGSPTVGRGLHELAEAIGADLLLVGSSRRGVLGRVLIGDETRGALNGAPCAIAIAPAGYSQEPVAMREIGVCYDGSPESELALELAQTLAQEVGAKLSAFQAIAVSSTALSTGPLPFHEMVSALVTEARERIAALGDIEPHAAYGEAAEELALYSASLDLLVVGSRGYGPIGRLIHGSTSQQLARSARCPLLVLPRVVHATKTGRAGGEDSEAALASRP